VSDSLHKRCLLKGIIWCLLEGPDVHKEALSCSLPVGVWPKCFKCFDESEVYSEGELRVAGYLATYTVKISYSVRASVVLLRHIQKARLLGRVRLAP
jgi:hypothetical protein